jgi:hypothetical protein
MTSYLVFATEEEANIRNRAIYDSTLTPAVRDSVRVTIYKFGTISKGEDSTEVALVVPDDEQNLLTNDEVASLQSQEDLEAAGWSFG